MTAPVPSRRDVLTGRAIDSAPAEIHISSLVLHVRPENLPDLRAVLTTMSGVEIHAEAGGKVVVTLETETEADIVMRMNELSLLPGVLSTALVFHQVDIDPTPPIPQQG